jgi:predicted phage terminase large subunit-like protein
MKDAMSLWDTLEAVGRKRKESNLVVRELALNDLFYLLVRVCKRVDLLHPWIYARCREIENDPNGHLDLWAREHYKSTLITFGLTIQNILKDPDITVGIFSHTRPIAKAFLRQIMRELENNVVLQGAFPDILWGKDLKDAPKWSEDEGIIVKRKSNPNEATVEAWGVVDGQPTSKHFRVLLYDDVVVKDSVTTPEMKQKTMSQLELSYNLGQMDGVRRMLGTRWDFDDAYRTVLERGTFKLRFHPGRENGEEEGKPVYWTEELHNQKRRDMGPYSYASQILLNPRADSLQGFKRDWLKHYQSVGEAWKKMTRYLLVDPASSKKKGSDYTCMWVVGLATDGNRYVLDIIRDRLSLTERADRVFDLHRKWKPYEVRYEKYGLQADIEHIQARQESENYRFSIREVGGQVKKPDRIGRLIPLFEKGEIYLPRSLHKTNYEKTTEDLVRVFIEEEYVAFPVGLHDDMLDSLARMEEPEFPLVWPKEQKTQIDPPRVFHRQHSQTAWMM